jgi:glutamyl/glutaminyl-tRNA synthetase
LALLGWNDGTDQEIFSLEELVEKFDLNRVHKAGAKFDPEKISGSTINIYKNRMMKHWRIYLKKM